MHPLFIAARKRLEQRMAERVIWFSPAKPTFIEQLRKLPWPEFHEVMTMQIEESK